MEKTNAMRILEQAGVDYVPHFYDDGVDKGEEVAALVGKSADEVFKTLVTVGSDRKNYVFVIPVNRTLDLKKAARAAGVKSVEMLKQKDLFSLTGYVHGGCSPVGMKKKFPTVIDETAQLFDHICVSAGCVGCNIAVEPVALARFIDAEFFDIVKEK